MWRLLQEKVLWAAPERPARLPSLQIGLQHRLCGSGLLGSDLCRADLRCGSGLRC